MPPAWWDETARFVDALEATQQELLTTLRQQRRALALADSAELERLNATAADAARRLDQLAARRGRLLEQASVHDGPLASLSVVLARSVSLEAERLRARLQAVQQRFAEVRREAWIQWVVTHRSQSFYAELLDLISHGGQKPPVYGEDARTLPSKGGVVLDAAA